VFLFFRSRDSDYCDAIAVQNNHTDLTSDRPSDACRNVSAHADGACAHAKSDAETSIDDCQACTNSADKPLIALKSFIFLIFSTLAIALAPHFITAWDTIAGQEHRSSTDCQ
jgi:hypothetical protein